MTTTPVSPLATPASIPLLNQMNMKDSRWLTLEVCREFSRNRCTRTEEECKFAHPPPHVDQQNGRVMCCFDSIKGKCQRKEPPCKYLHPPQHLKEQLLQNGRQNLALKYHYNQIFAAQNQPAFASPFAGQLMAAGLGMPLSAATPIAMDSRYLAAASGAGLLPAALPNQAAFLTDMFPGYFYDKRVQGVFGTPYSNSSLSAANPYLYQYAGLPQLGVNQIPIGLHQAAANAALESQALAQIPSSSTASSTTTSLNGQKSGRADRLEVCPEYTKGGACPLPDSECSFAHPPDYVLTEDDLAVVCMDFVKGKCTREHCKYYHPTPKLLQKVNQHRAALAAANQAQNQAAQALNHVLNAAVAAANVSTLQHNSTQQQQLYGIPTSASSAVLGFPSGLTSVSHALTPSMAAAFMQSNALHSLQGVSLAQASAMTGLPSAAAQASLQQQSAANTGTDVAVYGQQAKKRPREDELLLPMQGMPGVPIPVKRQALDGKGGMPVFQPAYQMMAAQPGQPAYVPVSFYGYDYTQHSPSYVVAGHPAGMQRL